MSQDVQRSWQVSSPCLCMVPQSLLVESLLRACQNLPARTQRVIHQPLSTYSAGVSSHSVCAQALKWGQDEAEHSNFRLQLGHSKAGHIAKHGALPSVLTADAPEVAPAVPAWCSLEATPGPGAYEPHVADKDSAFVTVARSAFGASGDGKASR